MEYPGYTKIKEILPVARGEKPGDLLLKNCSIPDIFKGSITRSNIVIKNGIIAGVGDYSWGEEVIDCRGKYAVPGFIDGHIHIESSHLLPAYFGAEAIGHGTTTIFTDPHEIANAAGIRGIKFFMKNAEQSPVDIFFLVPSCVPAIKLWDIWGNEITPEQIEELLKEKNVVGLAEMMNFPGVIYGDKEVWEKIAKAWESIKDGHAPLVSGKDLNAYLIANIGSDHESTVAAEGTEKISAGMFLMVREGSAARNLDILEKVLGRYNHDRIALVSDDLLPHELIEEGHLDRILRRARAKFKIDPYLLIRMVTFNPAWYFGKRDRGLIAPGKIADIVLLEDLENLSVNTTIKNGKIVFREGQLNFTTEIKLPQWIQKTVKIPQLKKEDFIYRCRKEKIKAIEIIPHQIITKEIMVIPQKNRGNIIASPIRDLAKAAVIDRYSGEGKTGIALVKGTGIEKGAIASTYAHDTHNLIILGVNEEDMAVAGNRIREIGGGLVVVEDGKVTAEVPFSVGGVVSHLPAGEVAEKVKKVNNAAKKLGITLEDPFVTLSFLSLSVIPELKLTPAGLINLTKMEKTRC